MLTSQKKETNSWICLTEDAVHTTPISFTLRPARGVLCVLLTSLTLSACAEGDGRTPIAIASVTGASTAQNPYGSATNKSQWKTALAALAQAPNPDPVQFDAPGISAYNELIANGWPHLAPRIELEVKAALQNAVGNALNGLSVLSLTSVDLDVSAAPAIGVQHQGSVENLNIYAPAHPGSWSLRLNTVLGGTVPINLFGISTQIAIQAPMTLTVSGIQATAPVHLDLVSNAVPELLSAGTPALQLQIALTSTSPILNTVTGLVTQLLDPIVRAALMVGVIYAQHEIGLLLQSMPNDADWGKGGPGVQPLATTVPLEPLALGVSDEIQRHHIPHGNMYPTNFDQPDQGGQVTSYRGHGDSALWTGAYLATEAYRFDLTGDPHALTRVDDILFAYDVMSRVASAPREGLLARSVIPESSPHHAVITPYDNYFTGEVDGIRYGALGDTSRDSYSGTMFGLGQTYHRLPTKRGKIRPIISRLLTYLEAHAWTVYKAPGQPNNFGPGADISVTFVQAPQQVLAFSTIGRVVDPVKWGPLHQRVSSLASILWLPTWISAQEVHESSYKLNLFHLNLTTLVEFETDPDRYRNYLQVLRIVRNTVAHHENPWYDAAYAVALPTAAAAKAPEIEACLQRWALRPRRGFAVQNSQDPTIQTAMHVPTTPNHTGTPGSSIMTGPRPQEVAVFPVPIEKRPSTAFLWSSSPFDLDGARNRKEQQPGVDLLLPYWLSRNHGILR